MKYLAVIGLLLSTHSLAFSSSPPDIGFDGEIKADFDFGSQSVATVNSDGATGLQVIDHRQCAEDEGVYLASAHDNQTLSVSLFNNDGQLNTNFANQGTQIIDIEGIRSAIAIDCVSDGSILIAVNTEREAAVVKLDKAGELDLTFANNGIAHYNFAIETEQVTDINDLVVYRDSLDREQFYLTGSIKTYSPAQANNHSYFSSLSGESQFFVYNAMLDGKGNNDFSLQNTSLGLYINSNEALTSSGVYFGGTSRKEPQVTYVEDGRTKVLGLSETSNSFLELSQYCEQTFSTYPLHYNNGCQFWSIAFDNNDAFSYIFRQYYDSFGILYDKRSNVIIEEGYDNLALVFSSYTTRELLQVSQSGDFAYIISSEVEKEFDLNKLTKSEVRFDGSNSYNAFRQMEGGLVLATLNKGKPALIKLNLFKRNSAISPTYQQDLSAEAGVTLITAPIYIDLAKPSSSGGISEMYIDGVTSIEYSIIQSPNNDCEGDTLKSLDIADVDYSYEILNEHYLCFQLEIPNTPNEELDFQFQIGSTSLNFRLSILEKTTNSEQTTDKPVTNNTDITSADTINSEETTNKNVTHSSNGGTWHWSLILLFILTARQRKS